MDDDRQFSDGDADELRTHLRTKNEHEMRQYLREHPDETESESGPHTDSIALLDRKINVLAHMVKRAHHANQCFTGAQLASSGLFTSGLLLAFAFMNQSTNNAVYDSNICIVQRINNLAAQCVCPPIPACPTHIPNTPNATTNSPFATDTTFLSMINGTTATNKTTD